MVPTAKYKEIVQTLKDEILGGRFVNGHAFPSSIMLARRFKTARATIRRALDELHHQGLVCSQRGRGTFVTKSARERKIGLIVPDVSYCETFPVVESVISHLCRQEGYTPVFGNAQPLSISAAGVEHAFELAEDFVRQGVKGVIFNPIMFTEDTVGVNRRLLSIFDRADVPVVLLDSDFMPFPERSKYDLVGIDNMSAGMQLARHLLAQGARNIHVFLRPNWASSTWGRMYGVSAAVVAAGGRWTSDNVFIAEPEDIDALRRHFRKRPHPDAFICGNDTTAARFRQTLAAAGYDVPRDLLLAGFDDVQIASLLMPPMTSSAWPCEACAEAAYRRLLARMAHPDLPRADIFLPSPIAVRASTRKLS